eukprot:COSAG01_NODE_35066_length_537_cov_4.812785_1_plen_52_part_00
MAALGQPVQAAVLLRPVRGGAISYCRSHAADIMGSAVVAGIQGVVVGKNEL